MISDVKKSLLVIELLNALTYSLAMIAAAQKASHAKLKLLITNFFRYDLEILKQAS